jgi:hypothetical protein
MVSPFPSISNQVTPQLLFQRCDLHPPGKATVLLLTHVRESRAED